MYCDEANKLITEAKRTKALENLPLYNSESVRKIVKEINDLQAKIQQAEEYIDTQNEGGTQNVQVFVNRLIQRRNKRILMAYEKLRAEKLEELAWGNIEPSQKVIQNLNYLEEEYLEQYNNLITEYKNELSDFDISGSLEPPSDIFIDVRVLKDVGEIQTEYGVFNLTKDSQFFVRYADVERLIQQGYLQKL